MMLLLGAGAPAVTLIYVSSSNAFAITGDLNAFEANFGAVQVVVRLHLQYF